MLAPTNTTSLSPGAAVPVVVPAGSHQLIVGDVTAETDISRQRSRELCEALEAGKIVCFPRAPFATPAAELEFLRSQKQSSSRFHKNIAYRPVSDRLTGYDRKHNDFARLHAVMRGFSGRVVRFVQNALCAYEDNWRLDYASFRPLQEKGRQVRLHARSDLLHVDAFPTRPTRGDRILRVFTNISPDEPREWLTSVPFHEMIGGLAGTPELPWPKPPSAAPWSVARRAAKRLGKALGLPVALRSPYDDFMIRAYRHMKENETWQRDCPHHRSSFPPGWCWMVFTDSVPHAALSGQFALEQTFIISIAVMVDPHRAPINVLEAQVGRPLTGIL